MRLAGDSARATLKLYGTWRTAARGLLPSHEFAASLGEIALAVLISREPTHATQPQALLTDVVHEVGWRSTATGLPPAEHDIRWACSQTTNLLRALNLLSTGGDWQDRTYQLTPTG